MSSTSDPIRVDIISDVVCPWCAIGYHQLAVASRETQIPIKTVWHPFELNPGMAAEGENLREHLAAKYGTTLEGSIKARANLTEMGKALGFTFNYADDMRMWNTFSAHQVIDHAEEHGLAHEMKMALFEAYFTKRLNVSDIEVLASVAGEVGLDKANVLNELQTQSRAAKVRTKETEWINRGIRGVPAMIFDQREFAPGAQGVSVYSELLRSLS